MEEKDVDDGWMEGERVDQKEREWQTEDCVSVKGVCVWGGWGVEGGSV